MYSCYTKASWIQSNKNRWILLEVLEAYSQRSLFAEIINGFKALTIFVKSTVLIVWIGSECTSAFMHRQHFWTFTSNLKNTWSTNSWSVYYLLFVNVSEIYLEDKANSFETSVKLVYFLSRGFFWSNLF